MPTNKNSQQPEVREVLMEPLLQTNLEDVLGPCRRGKVRDIYDLGDSLLLVASDRISAFDVVMDQGIPDKGKILTQISAFWFKYLSGIVPNHLISLSLSELPPDCLPFWDMLDGRIMLVKKSKPLPVECIVRGYITGSAWGEYKKTGAVCGIELPQGLVESQRLPEPIFTPSTKAELGEHDENISFTAMAHKIGRTLAERVRQVSLALYVKACELAEPRGIILADTKFEFGLRNKNLLLIDEVLTPDSSRFWPMEDYKPGGPQKSYDKQYLRDFLETLDWNKQPPPPPLPPEVIAKTGEKYHEALLALTGHDLD